jgi:hypothetical protein
MSDYSRDDQQRVAEQFKSDLELIQDYLRVQKIEDLREEQDIEVRFFSEVFCDMKVTSRVQQEFEIREENLHCNHYGCEEMLSIEVHSSDGQIGIDNITWNWDDAKDEMIPVFYAEVIYLDRSRVSEQTGIDGMVYKTIKQIELPFRRAWIEETDLQAVLDYLKSGEFLTWIRLLSDTTHRVPIN